LVLVTKVTLLMIDAYLSLLLLLCTVNKLIQNNLPDDYYGNSKL